jgi:uncharacterized glyoxalase superfamily protein PhnB
MNQIQRCSPVFAVANPPRLADYYADKLGFTIVGDAMQEYAIVSRGGFEIHFHLAEHKSADALETDEYRGGAYFLVDDPDSIYEELIGRGTNIQYAPEDRPYGMRDFSVRDLEGNSICFGKMLT